LRRGAARIGYRNGRQVRIVGQVLSNAFFPLTPALSLREREYLRPVVRRFVLPFFAALPEISLSPRERVGVRGKGCII